MKIQRGARPIQSQEILAHYHRFQFSPVSLELYTHSWRNWLSNSRLNTLSGLEEFQHADFTHGTSQVFDHFWLKHRHRRAVIFRGEFQYHACVNRFHDFCWLDTADDLGAGDALIISLPFSDYGKQHPDWSRILHRCDTMAIPVCIDLAYWGIAHDITLDLADHVCIEQVTCSLSKPFWTLEHHRVGVRFSRHYSDDGISMINEVNTQNFHSMSLGHHFMLAFDCDWVYNRFRPAQIAVCDKFGLQASDTVIFGHGGVEYCDHNRGIAGNNRVCISEFLHDTAKEQDR